MHQGCFVWTLTPPLAGQRTPRPGPVHVCVCSSILAGSGGPASQAWSGAPHLFLWLLCLSALLGPLRARFALVLVLCFPAVSFFAFFFPFLRCFFPCAPFVSCFLWFPAPYALGLGALCCLFCWPRASWLSVRSRFLRVAWPLAALQWLPPPPPSPWLLLPFLVALRLFFFPLVCAPLFLAFCVFRPRVPRALALVCVCFARLSVLCVVFFSAPRFFLRSRLFCVPWLAAGCCPPPPLLCLAVFVVFARCLGFFFSPLVRPRCLRLPLVSGPGCPGPWRWVLFVCLSLPLPGSPCALASFVSPAWPWAAPSWLLPPPPPSPFVSPRFRRSCSVPWFFLLPLCAPVVSGFLWFLAPGALGLGAVRCLLCWPSASPLYVRSRLVGCSLVVAAPPPPPPLCLAVFVAAARCCVPCAVLCCVSLGAVLRRAAARCAARCCALVCFVALVRTFGAAACCAMPSGAARRPGALCFAALCFAVFPPAVCSVLCAFCRGVVLRPVVCRSALCCVCPGVLCCAFPVLSALCGAALRCAGALALCCSCGACCCWRLVLCCAAVCCAVSFGVLWCGADSGGPWLSAGGMFRCRCTVSRSWLR